MAVDTVDVEALLGSYVANLNRAIDTPQVRTVRQEVGRTHTDFTNWGGLDAASPRTKEITPDGKVRGFIIRLEI